MAAKPKLLFGLALDEKMRWATAEAWSTDTGIPHFENVTVGSQGRGLHRGSPYLGEAGTSSRRYTF